MAAGKRVDNKGRALKTGESQRKQDGRYQYRYMDCLGKRQYVYSMKLLPTDTVNGKKSDEISLREMEKQITRDLDDGIRTAESNKITFNDMFMHYMDTKRNLKATTKNNYMYMFEKYIKNSALGNRTLSKIRKSDIIKFYSGLLDSGFKTNSLETIHTLMHPTFTMAVDDDIIRKNPSDGVMQMLDKTEAQTKIALTVKQQENFIDFISNSVEYSHWLPVFTTFLGTGMRVSELIGLTWDDVDLKNGTISVNHNLVYRKYGNNCEFHITTPKTEKGTRTIPMLSEVKQQIIERRKQQFAEGKPQAVIDGVTNFVFTNRYGNPHTPMCINRAIKRIYTAFNNEEKEKAKREHREPELLPHFSVHILRHTFCTRFCENETNVKVIQQIMGHSDISVTMNIYSHVTEDKAKECMKNLENKIKIS